MKILTVGECMVEFFCEADARWRRGFAGDTLNTAWALRAILPDEHSVGFVSQIGSDAVSDDLVTFMSEAGISTEHLVRNPDRTLGLYTIATDDDGERSFSYWRSASAARHLADDAGELGRAFEFADVIYLSGITAAILDIPARQNLLQGLRNAQKGGARIVYDSNHRPALWENVEATRVFADEIGSFADILLPTFDDEAQIFGDKTSEDTLDRLEQLGCREIILTNGADPVLACIDGTVHRLPLAKPVKPLDTTGAGDSFSGGYLAARVLGFEPQEAVAHAQAVAGEVVCYRVALIPMDALKAAFNN